MCDNMLERIGQERIHKIIKDNLPVGFSIVDSKGTIVDFNKAAEVITGFTKAEVVGMSHFQVFHGTSDKNACPLLKHTLLEHEEVVATESSIMKKNGDYIFISATSFPLVDDEGIFLGGVILFRDITISKKMAREHENILSMFAHDMKNPVMTSGGLISRLLSGKAGKLSEKQQNYLDIVSSNLDKVEKLVSDFLEFSKLDTEECTPKLEPFNIVSVINKVIGIIKLEANHKNVRITFDYPHDFSGIINADSMMMDRLITNLLGNALKYSHQDGNIKIELSSSDKEIIVQITDTGIGIPENKLPYIFDAFFQVNRDVKGSGLGLAIARNIIEAHGGRIWVESTSGVGTTFSFTLPKKRIGSAHERRKNV